MNTQKFLYHRTHHHKDVENIIAKKAIIPSKHLKKKETKCGSHAYDFVSLTEGKCVKTGGKFQIILDREKLMKKNEIFDIWRKIDPKGPGSIFLHELEWRSCDNVVIDKNDIKELVLYKNYMTAMAPHFREIAEHKREMTIAEKELKEIGKKHKIPVRVISFDSKECDEEERKKELREMFEEAGIKINKNKI